eukprot:TRINITY_DN17384_c0_g1_i1.p1 TRINITY_DN17384_c0_g1~~TRINITY_DN17384_c0_g1_i1.p1  ORF type:complete len:865 (-),score=178.38 TRINITY_DN17384_c0_g1_i1:265-2859(-)
MFYPWYQRGAANTGAYEVNITGRQVVNFGTRNGASKPLHTHALRGGGLVFAAIGMGLMVAITAAFIELTSNFVADLRHGVCVERMPGDTRPLWQATMEGGFRPYDRTRCCGGSPLVDHVIQECRAPSIIRHSLHKRFAITLPELWSFGRTVDANDPSRHRNASTPAAVGNVSGAANQTGVDSFLQFSSSSGRRVEHLDLEDAVEASRVRSRKAKRSESAPQDSAKNGTAMMQGAAEIVESEHHEMEVIALGEDDFLQTQSESAGDLVPTQEWVPWDRLIPGAGNWLPIVMYVGGGAILAVLSACITACYPSARGSGISEVKANVAGFHVPNAFKLSTLAAKVPGLALCVGSGLALGKEGPMIHIGGVWGSLLAEPLARLGVTGNFEAPQDTELICVGVAAGVSAAFGAPLGGVLFAVEEMGTTVAGGLRYSTMLCAFGAAITSSLALRWLDLEGTQRLTLFEVDYRQAWAPWEVVPFLILGVLGGVLGGGFVHLNEAVHKRRKRCAAEQKVWFLPDALNKFCGLFYPSGSKHAALILEVLIIAVFTGFTNYPCGIMRLLQNDAITALFAHCPEGDESMVTDPLGLCGPPLAGDIMGMERLMRTLTGAALFRWLQCAITFGALVPAGLFVPSLFIGGCFGRAMGSLLQSFGLMGAQGAFVEPGIYAMVGAGAMLAGISRLTVCLVVVLFELTGGLTYVVPFMVAVLTAKWIGDALSGGRSIYDVYAVLNGFAKVEQMEDCNVPNVSLRALCPEGSSLVDVAHDLECRKGPTAAEALSGGALSACVDAGKVVLVREDCPLLAAFSIFHSRPAVQAVASVARTSKATTRIVTRDLFLNRLRSNPLLAGLADRLEASVSHHGGKKAIY